MSHLTNITPAASASEAEQLELLAQSILAGDWSALPTVNWTYYEVADWQSAADGALEIDEYSELDEMLSKEMTYDAWFSGLSDSEREAWDFGDYFASSNRIPTFIRGTLSWRAEPWSAAA